MCFINSVTLFLTFLVTIYFRKAAFIGQSCKGIKTNPMTRPRFDGSVSLIQKLTKELFLHFERKVKENSPEVSDNRMALEVLAFVHRYLKNGNEIKLHIV